MQFEFHEIFYFDGAENGSIENEKKTKKNRKWEQIDYNFKLCQSYKHNVRYVHLT